MARKHSSKGGGAPKAAKAKGAPGSRINKMEKYEDTLEPGSVDDFMFKRDQIMFNPQNESDEEDINANQGQEVLALPSRRKRTQAADADDDEDLEEGEDEEEEEEDDVGVLGKKRKDKVKADRSGAGRFGKAVEDSDEEEGEGSGSGSGSDEDEEGWGRQYYARPSTRRGKEKEGEYDEKREEEREMEEKEVRRLQRKQREAFGGPEDWGLVGEALEDAIDVAVKPSDEGALAETRPVPVPETEDPADLLRHLQAYEPVKLALTRDFPLIVRKLEKTARGIHKMMDEPDGEESLHKGLGWLHYQTLLTYASTLAFYLHLASLPASSRPDLSTHPILPRLLQLKEGVAMLEDLDFAAGSVSDGDPLLEGLQAEDEEEEDEDEDAAELLRAKRELMARMVGVPEGGWGSADDADDLWTKEGLEDGELDDLMADLQEEERAELAGGSGKKNAKTAKVSKAGAKANGEPRKPQKEKRKKRKEQSDAETGAASSATVAFQPLQEPEFKTSKPSQKSKSLKSARASFDDEDLLGDPTELNDADAADKAQRKRSLQFHTAKIAATSRRREAAREGRGRLQGDDDIPVRDRARARDAVLRRNGTSAEGEDLETDGGENGAAKKKAQQGKRDRDGEDEAEEGDDGYYELVKRRKTEEKEAKQQAHEEAQEAHFAQLAQHDDSADGPRTVTRAIEKNRGLTPRRSKTGRNPRVKKRQAYEKAKRKVGSQRAVFKGGQASLGGSYKGEQTGISTKSKSRRF